jgi:tetratricopeptide (TPR) repeat protein
MVNLSWSTEYLLDFNEGQFKDMGYLSRMTGKLVPLLASVLLLAACATTYIPNIKPPPLLVDAPEVQVVDVDVLAASPAMDEFLERYILPYTNKHTRLTLLMNAVSGNGALGFRYDEGLTLTATEAFDTRAGNCIGFANMLVALSRRAGLKAEYQEVFRTSEWSSREDTVLLVKHVNVVLESAGYTYVMDVSGLRFSPNVRRRIISDDYAKALYLNNIGAESLIMNDLPTAYAYMAKAIKTEPLLTDSWVNMGVVLGRNEQLDDAAFALRTALDIDSYEYSAASNLYEVYIAQGDLESAAELEDKVERYRRNNPYYLLQLSEEALVENNYDESLKLLQRAIKKKDTDHKLHFAMATTQYLSGETEAAQSSLSRARELAPESMLVYYDRPLDVLATEYEAELSAEYELE